MNVPMASGAGVYFDGITSTRHDVLVVLKPAGLQISGHDGHPLNEWPYDELEELSAPDSLLRLGRLNSAVLERLEISDKTFAAEIDARAALVDRTGTLQRRQRLSVIAWSIGATASLLLVAWFGVPGMGGVLHTVNPRLFDGQLEFIVNHAEDRVLLYDRAFAPLVERMKPRWTSACDKQ